MSKTPDHRLTLARPDLADGQLMGKVAAKKYAATTPYQVIVPVTGLYLQPEPDQSLQTELLFGECFMVLEIKNGKAWGQAVSDGFVGYVDASALSQTCPSPTHWVCALRTPLYKWPDLKAPVSGFLHKNSQVHISDSDDHYRNVGPGWIHAGDLATLGDWHQDFVATALQYLHTPYVWGGRSSLGLDCSALLQNALFAAGRSCLRDADMQETSLGQPVAFSGNTEQLHRGDLVFWKGHVGIIADHDQLLHANAHHMATALEPAKPALQRIQKTAGPVTSVRRFLEM
ncbi:NLP/P60 family lipoprotein [hydrothermal vent metagenome]|uniref:NLP/P60 family lipoprotein n=1 Tax=hydrothermal vent metagenome TaxID=652676 RepID=A0A3B0RQT8_9ZZZZ